MPHSAVSNPIWCIQPSQPLDSASLFVTSNLNEAPYTRYNLDKCVIKRGWLLSYFMECDRLSPFQKFYVLLKINCIHFCAFEIMFYVYYCYNFWAR